MKNKMFFSIKKFFAVLKFQFLLVVFFVKVFYFIFKTIGFDMISKMISPLYWFYDFLWFAVELFIPVKKLKSTISATNVYFVS